MVKIPRKYFLNEALDAKLASLYQSIVDCGNNFEAFKFNRENICKGLLDESLPEATITELRKTLETKKAESKQTLERLPYFMSQVDFWEGVKNTPEDGIVEFTDIDEIEALIK